MADSDSELGVITKQLREFSRVRDWDKFHTPKNLAMALSGEAGELLEHFQWLTPEQSCKLDANKRHEVSLEMADILIYLLKLEDHLDINLLEAVHEKMAINENRFPVDKVRGRAGSHE